MNFVILLTVYWAKYGQKKSKY